MQKWSKVYVKPRHVSMREFSIPIDLKIYFFLLIVKFEFTDVWLVI